ncbi:MULTISPECIES: acyltransferase [unclassified Pseudomonas]|uniref:acyltransferase n=1 Tax=Pseudomonas TaxID=286 RepID=UPI0010129D25|nr:MULTISPECIES: acyltransferase [unclassified Pseudomonas]KAA0983558.1 acyltransferase [Pseudomonas sp. ANT_J28]QAY88485.1 acyltransferase [Pseudomonas sp. ACM7]TFB44058.1 acyltransferase [Pseudomonas sp. F01002]
MIGLLKRIIAHIAKTTGHGTSLYKKFCKPDGYEWAKHMVRWGGLHSIGKGVWINPAANITDPSLVRLGNNVGLSCCTLFGHDGIVGLLEVRYGKKLDSVGAIDIRDNCFIGYGSIIMPRVTIGPDSIVAAGAVVVKDVPPGVVVAGNPAKVICTMEEVLAKVEERSATYPWIDLIRQRSGVYDPALEPKLIAMRAQHFFGEQPNG